MDIAELEILEKVNLTIIIFMFLILLCITVYWNKKKFNNKKNMMITKSMPDKQTTHDNFIESFSRFNLENITNENNITTFSMPKDVILY